MSNEVETQQPSWSRGNWCFFLGVPLLMLYSLVVVVLGCTHIVEVSSLIFVTALPGIFLCFGFLGAFVEGSAEKSARQNGGLTRWVDDWRDL